MELWGIELWRRHRKNDSWLSLDIDEAAFEEVEKKRIDTRAKK